MAANGHLRGWPIYYHEGAEEWRFCDTDEPTVETWSKRPCGHCGLYGNSNDGEVDPCLGFLPGVTNACCGHGDPDMAYICFQGGLVLRGFDVDEFHRRRRSEDEQRTLLEFDEALRRFRRMPCDEP